MEYFESEKNKIERSLASISECDEGSRWASEIIDICFYEPLNQSLTANVLNETKSKSNLTCVESLTPEIYECLAIFNIFSDKGELLDSAVKTQEGVKWFNIEIDTEECLTLSLSFQMLILGEMTQR